MRLIRRLALAGVAVVAALAAYSAYLVSVITKVPPAAVWTPSWRPQIAVVLSGDPNNLRTLEGVRLQRIGVVDRVLITGAGFGGDSSEFLGRVALEHGLPTEALMLETKATSTWENFMFVRQVLESEGIERAVFVTSRIHARRAMAVADRVLDPASYRFVLIRGPDEDLFNEVVEILKALRYAVLGRIDWSVALGIERGRELRANES